MTREEEDKIILELYPTMSSKTLAKKIKRGPAYVLHRAKELGMQDIIDKKRGSSQFKSGHKPHNKGRRWDEYMTKEAQEKVKAGWFNKERVIRKPLYSISIRKDPPSGRFYKYIKLADRKWVLLSRYVYEQHNGPIPKGHNVRFKNGDTMNCNIDNLELVTRAEMMLRNSVQDYAPELIDTHVAISKLKKKINSLTNKKTK